MVLPEDACIKSALELVKNFDESFAHERISSCLSKDHQPLEDLKRYELDSEFLIFCELFAYCSIDKMVSADLSSVIFDYCSEAKFQKNSTYIDVIKSKLMLRLTKTHCGEISNHCAGKICKVGREVVMSGLDVVHHNVAESLALICRYAWPPVVEEFLEEAVRSHSKFSLILLKKIASISPNTVGKFSNDLIEEICSVCLTLVVEHNSKSSLNLIGTLIKYDSFRCGFSKIARQFEFVDDRGKLLNISCSKLLENFPDIRPFVESNSAHCMPLDLDVRVSIISDSIDALSRIEVYYMLLSILVDCTPKHFDRVCSCSTKVLNLLDNRQKEDILLLIDNRAPLRMRDVLLHVLSRSDAPLLREELFYIACCNSFEVSRRAALNFFLSAADDMLLELPKTSSMEALKDGFFLGPLAIIQMVRLGTMSFVNDGLLHEAKRLVDFNSKSFHNIFGIVGLLEALCCVLEHFIAVSDNRIDDWMLTARQFCLESTRIAFSKCNVDAPESYLFDNDIEDIDTRNEWKIVQQCAIFLSLCGSRLSHDCIYSDLMMLSSMIVHLKHRGAFASLFNPIVRLASILFSKAIDQNVYFESYLSHCWNSLLSDSIVDGVTRRSAGIPYLFKSVLHSVSQSDISTVYSSIVERLLQICKSEDSSTSDLIRIRSVNVLCEILKDRNFDELSSPYASRCLDVSFDLLLSDVWGLRNVALRLFSAVYNRCIQVRADVEGFVDLRRLIKFFSLHLVQVLQDRMLYTKEEHVLPILVILAKIRPPLGSFEDDILVFIESTRTFLSKISPACRNYYVSCMISRASSHFQLDLKPLDFLSLTREGGNFSYPSCVSSRFTPKSLISEAAFSTDILTVFRALSVNFESLQTGLSKDHHIDYLAKFGSNESIFPGILRQCRSEDQLYRLIYKNVQESCSVNIRRMAASFLVDQFSNSLSLKYIPILYKLILDDDEEVRYLGCKCCSILFSESSIGCSTWYVKRIWEHVASLDSNSQQSLFGLLFLGDFSLDLSREIKNCDEKPLFRREPLNVYRDYLVESFVISNSLENPSSFLPSRLTSLAADECYTGCHFLRRSFKCINVLAKTQPA